MIHAFWPSLLDIGFIVSLVTPVIKARARARALSFTPMQRSGHGTPNNKTKQVGESSITRVSGRRRAPRRASTKAIDTLTVRFVVDERADEAIVLAFDKSKADDRKRWLLESTGAQGLEVPHGEIQSLSVSDFVHKDLVNFSLADIRRSIASVVDGFKP